MRIEPSVSSTSIVLLGSFNPAILTPAWFAMNNLLPAEAADTAELHVAHPQLTAFTTDWLQLNVTTEQFAVHTAVPPDIRLCDLVRRLFGELLSHTPLTAFGINREVHFRVANSDTRDRLLHLLAPADPWVDLDKVLASDGHSGRMTSLTMMHATPSGRLASGHINVTVEPSHAVGHRGTGLYVRVNHHLVPDDDGQGGAHPAVVALEDTFESSIKNSDVVIDHVMSLSTTAA